MKSKFHVVKTHVKCVDCKTKREVYTQDAAQVKRCADCQKAYREKRYEFARYRKFLGAIENANTITLDGSSKGKRTSTRRAIQKDIAGRENQGHGKKVIKKRGVHGA